MLATGYWAAKKGRDALKVTWDDGPNKAYDSVSYKAALMESVRKPGKAGRTNGDATAALASASRKVSAEYYMPHLSHAQMEPVAAIAIPSASATRTVAARLTDPSRSCRSTPTR